MSFFRATAPGKAKLFLIPLACVAKVTTVCDWDDNWDFRAEKRVVAPTRRTVHRLILVRHGQYCSGSTDAERKLTELGRRQAEETGKRIALLQKEASEPEIRNVYYSTMARATETAQIMLPYISNANTKVEPCSMIREGACYRPVPPISKARWPVTDEDFHVDGKRIEAAFTVHCHRPGVVDSVEDSKSDAKNKNTPTSPPKASEGAKEEGSYSTVLVCHGNVIRYFVCRALQLDPECWLRMAVNNGSYTVLDIFSDGRVSLRALGVDGHFQPEDVTYM